MFDGLLDESNWPHVIGTNATTCTPSRTLIVSEPRQKRDFDLSLMVDLWWHTEKYVPCFRRGAHELSVHRQR